MKLFNILKIGAVALFAASLVGCKEDEFVKPSALITESSLTFEAKDAEPQLLTVASDADWMVDVDADWISVDPMSGTNTVKVTVAVEDNVDAQGVLAAPRQGVITIANNRGYSVTAIIYQKGDTYLGVAEMPVSDVLALEDGKYAKIAEAQVVALTDEGFVASDASGMIYVKPTKEAAAEVALGDKVFLAGEKVTLYGAAALSAGDVTVNSNGEVTRPEPLPLLSNLDPSKATKIMYVSVDAGILGRDLKFDQELPVSISLLDPKAGDVDLDAVNMHNISLKAYFIGLDGDNVKLAAVSVEDKGENESLMAFFYDDFSWMKPLIPESVKVGDSIKENNAGADAPNVRSNSSLSNLLKEFTDRGYEDLNPSSKTLYAQAYYWKMGKTSTESANNNNGLKLPKMEFNGSELINVYIEFDWAAHMTGAGNIDKVEVVAELEGNGLFENGTNVSDPFVTTQENGHIEWQHAKVLAKGVNNETRIILRPAQYASVTPDQQRWHVDNIKVSDSHIPYKEPVYADLSVSDEVVTFEGTPSGPAKLTVKSDNAWTITKGADSDWFSVDVTEGTAGENVEVKVTCEPSTSSTLRHGTMVIASADTRKTVHVVQSAAGGELEPLISIASGNSVTVIGEGAEFETRVQSNVDFETEILSDWITAVPTVTKNALVSVKTLKFKAAVNLTGAARTGSIRFHSGNIESVLTVKQENFVPRIDVSAPFTYLGVPGIAGTVSYSIDSNIPFTITANGASWVTLPAANGTAGKYTIPVAFAANSSADVRTAEITLSNSDYAFSKTIEVKQFPANVLFADDFSWLTPLAKAAGAGDTIGNKDKGAAAPNIYGTADLKSAFVPLRDAIGYVIPGAADGANNVVYLQDSYLKMGKTSTSSQTSLTLPGIYNNGKDYVLSFDWARMAQGDGTIDNYTLTLMITGNGTFENGTKYSEEFSTPQGKDELFWTTFSAKIKGSDSSTRITFVATALLNKETGKIDYTKSGGKRMFIDNIKAVVE